MLENQLYTGKCADGFAFKTEDEYVPLNSSSKNNCDNNNYTNNNNNYYYYCKNVDDQEKRNNESINYNEQNEYVHNFPKKIRINLEFNDIQYKVKKWSLRRAYPEIKDILKGVSGQFFAEKLTAIMGPSGAGKSTLLNVLAAYKLRGVSGSVKINNKERSSQNPQEFKRLSCYIQQNDYLRSELKVCEAMTYTADLKLGSSVSKKVKQEQIKELLKMLGLLHCWDTVTGGLSGGQKKRLSIALELISNPPIIFLDEPTTGLDSSSCSQCVSLLKVLAQEGRTVVCTIHQPSALIFEMFDHLYALSAGECIYSGPVNSLIGYLGEMNLVCPKYHNPADFLLDVAVGECGADFRTLVTTAKSFLLSKKEESDLNAGQVSEVAGQISSIGKLTKGEKWDENNLLPISKIKPASFLKQFWLLYRRNLVILKRKPGNVLVRAAAHILIALLFGYLYRDVGVKATTVLANYCYLYGSNLFVVYTGKMSVTLLFPLELCIVSREHFNRWYTLGPYYASMILVEIPFQIICCWLYLPLSYHLTGQPLEWNRFLYFSIIATASSLAAQAFGFLLGISLPKKIAVFLGPVLACLLSVFGFCLRFVDTPRFFRWLYYISYYRASFQSSVYSIYGLNRSTLVCEEFYCHFKNPKKFLLEMDMPEIYLELNFALIFVWVVVLHVLTVIVVWFKLNRK